MLFLSTLTWSLSQRNNSVTCKVMIAIERIMDGTCRLTLWPRIILQTCYILLAYPCSTVLWKLYWVESYKINVMHQECISYLFLGDFKKRYMQLCLSKAAVTLNNMSWQSSSVLLTSLLVIVFIDQYILKPPRKLRHIPYISFIRYIKAVMIERRSREEIGELINLQALKQSPNGLFVVKRCLRLYDKRCTEVKLNSCKGYDEYGWGVHVSMPNHMRQVLTQQGKIKIYHWNSTQRVIFIRPFS